MKKRRIMLTAISTIAALLLLAIGTVAAQDDDATTTPPPFLGILFEESDEGVLVSDVVEESAAAAAGIEVGDVITAVNGEIVTAENIAETISTFVVGDTITVDLLRDAEALSVAATLTERPTPPPPPSIVPMRERAYLGIGLANDSNVPTIASIQEGSPAEDAGLQVGDIVVGFNGETVENTRDLVEQITSAEIGDEITLSVERDGETVDVEVTLGAFPFRNMPNMRDNFRDDFGMGMGMNLQLDENGLTIESLEIGSPLAEAGLMVGDTITAINGESLDMRSIPNLLQGMGESDTITLTVERDGESIEIDITPEALLGVLPMMPFNFNNRGNMPGFGNPNFDHRGNMPGSPMITNRARLGVTFITLDEQTAVEYEAEQTEGALITAVDDNGPAAQAGLQVGDVITAIDGDVVDAERTLSDRLFSYEPEDVITVSLLRDGESLDIEVTLGRFEQQGMNFFNFGDHMRDFGFGGNRGDRMPGFRFNFPLPNSMPDEQSIPVTPNADL